MRTPSASILEMARSLFAGVGQLRIRMQSERWWSMNTCAFPHAILRRGGFAARPRRALALASTQMPTLKSSKVGADGRIPPELAPSDVQPEKHPRGRPVPSRSKGKSHA